MGFFDSIGSRISNVGNQVSSKVSNSGEQLKLSSEINGLKAQISQHYQKLGEMYYAENRENADPQDYAAECDVIAQLKDLIAQKEKQIKDIKAQITCPVCGKSIAADSVFCPNCGAPIAHAEQPSKDKPSATKICPHCGAALPEDAVFCTSCGAKVDGDIPASDNSPDLTGNSEQ